MRDLVFVHIPKTAGTSLRSALVAAFPEKRVLFDYGETERLTSNEIREIRYSGKNKPERLRELTGSTPIVLMGHFPARDYLDLFAYENFITFVREPIARVISDYKHFVRHFAFKESLVEFASQPALRNRQSAFLMDLNIDDIGFIGVAEEYDNSIVRLGDFLGREIRNVKSNQAPDDQIVAVSDEEIEIVRNLNLDDIMLYRHVLDMKAKRVTKGISGVRGSATRTDNHSIRGWAVCTDTKRIVRLGLEIDGSVISEDGIICDIYRPDLITSGESPNGLGGFEIDLSPYSAQKPRVVRIFSDDWSLTI
ncbi:MAG: sulfotransferase family 2 domain-containing protein [Rhizobiaceae bacterium]|jgi:hypothetical protein